MRKQKVTNQICQFIIFFLFFSYIPLKSTSPSSSLLLRLRSLRQPLVPSLAEGSGQALRQNLGCKDIEPSNFTCSDDCIQEHLPFDQNVQSFIENIIQNAIKNGEVEFLSEGLSQCYQRIQKGFKTFHLNDLQEALPELLQELKQVQIQNKALRPDGPSATANNAIVGPGTCDLAPVLQLINLVKCKLEECCAELEKDFRETWTILADIKETVTECCETLCDKFEQTWTILGDITAAFCNPTFIRQQDIGTTTFTIDSPGVYKFAEDIVFSPVVAQPAIEITVNEVMLDLQCFSLSQGNATSGVDGIRIIGGSSGSPRSDVEVLNGIVKNFTRAGITVGTNPTTAANTACTRVALHDIDVVNCAIRGIEFEATAGTTEITQSSIEDCRILTCCSSVSADFALTMSFCNDVLVANCNINTNTSASATLTVVNVQDCTKCRYENIEANGNSSTTLIGFTVHNSIKCRFNTVLVKNNMTSSAQTLFDLGGTSINNKFQNCCVVENTEGVIIGFNIAAPNNVFMNCIVLGNDTSSGALTGFRITGGATTSGNLLFDCIASNNNTDSGQLNGFALLTSVTLNTLKNCEACNNTATGATAASNCFGFNMDQANSCSLIECIANYNRATGDGTTNIAAGFNIGTSSTGGVTNSQIDDCRAFSNDGFTDARSFGIRAVSTAGGNVNNFYIKNIAARNGPNVPVVGNQITSTAGGGSSPGGVPAGSIINRTLSNLNVTDRVLANYRII